jgi:glucose/arabinose dehydrogenase
MPVKRHLKGGVMDHRFVRVVVLVWTSLLYACHGQSQPTVLVKAFPALVFSSPVFLTTAGDGTHRLFVVEQTGRIKAFQNDSTASSAAVFLNVANKLSSGSGEEGLLGLAFDPKFSSNGFFYVNYTAPNPLRTVIARYHASAATPNKADSLSGFTILEIAQPFSNHNGGMIAFGPDGYLYIGMGDGGSADDPGNRAQDLTQLLGKYLRIDVSDTTATRHYRIPPDNPLAGNLVGQREEIWAYGLRNPWRWSFDSHTGSLWCGDVGQGAREEVDLIVRGGNYGWKIMEGLICRPGGGACDTTGLIKPLVDYSHDLGIAVTGGYVYHGYRRPDLSGAYIYADYGSGRMWMLRMTGPNTATDSLLTQAPFMVSSFGQDEDEELYVVQYGGSGNIYRFAGGAKPTAVTPLPEGKPHGVELAQNFPNPFNPSTTVEFSIKNAEFLALKVYDLLGREVAVLVDGYTEAGSHSVRFNAAGLASGTYVCRLTAGAEVQTRMMMLVR